MSSHRFKVGDKVRDRDWGLGVVEQVDELGLFPYLVKFKCKSYSIWCFARHLKSKSERWR